MQTHRFSLFCFTVLLHLAVWGAEVPDDAYFSVFEKIQRGDQLMENQQYSEATEVFQAAQTELQALQRNHPAWNPTIVEFRLRFIDARLIELQQPSGDASVSSDNVNRTEATGPSDPVQLLQMQVRQLQSEKGLLEAKLREALSGRPAALDTRELVEAEAIIREQQKEIAILRTRMNARATNEVPATTEGPESDARAAELEETEQELNRLGQEVAQLSLERQALLQRIRSGEHPDETARLATENQELAEQVKQLQSAVALLQTGATGGDRRKGLTEAQAQLARLRNQNALLATENRVLQRRLEVLSTSRTNTASAATTTTPPATQTERDELQRQMDALMRELVRERTRHLLQTNTAVPSVSDGTSQSEQTNASPAPPETWTQHREVRNLIEADRLADADRLLGQGLAVAPEDPRVLFLLGRLRFEQERYDEALSALSRVSRAYPRDAETCYYLGVTLSAKGMPGAGESALRRAVQFDPQNARAHAQLAGIYATRTPPSPELALKHYDLALSVGGSVDPALEALRDRTKTAAVGPSSSQTP